MKQSMFGAVVLFCASSAAADAPRVAVDIPPVHALAARVMEGVGAPDLVLPPGASPHGHALKPSQAQALADADLVVWIGEGLTPWLEGPIRTLAKNARGLELGEAPGVTLLPLRDDPRFEAHHHHGEHGHDHEHEHAGEEHAHEGHAHDHADHADTHHAAAHHDDAHHHHDGADMHLWLDPENGAAMMDAIAGALAGLDPAHAAAYRANAAAGRAELAALSAELSATLAPVATQSYIVFHDAYQYFETRFGVGATGAVSIGDARKPGAERLQRIRDIASETGAVCIFTEPQFPPKLADQIAQEIGAKIGVLDPLGARLEPGAALYPELLRNLAASLRDCLES